MEITGGQVGYRSGGRRTRAAFRFVEGLSTQDLLISSTVEQTGNARLFSLVVKPAGEIELDEVFLEAPLQISANDRIYLGGFQSWTESREFGPGERIPRLNGVASRLLRAYGDYAFYRYTGKPGRLHGWTYTYIRRGNEYTLLGSLSEAAGYTLFAYDARAGVLRIGKDCAGVRLRSPLRAFDVYVATGSEQEVFAGYFEHMKVPEPRVKPCTGWTSWYNYYTGITERLVLDNLDAFARRGIPIDAFQIDDGYQNAVGDWLVVNHKFPRGMKYIADEIKKRGYKAGLWLAPFACEKKSILFKEHADWVLRDAEGRLVKAGFNPGWSGTFYALDFYNSGVREYLGRVFDTILNMWGFDMVKLDFLYAVALLPRDGRPRGQVMTEAMDFLRKLAGDKIILGCGVPLGPAFGRVDYCRIGSDVALKWEDNLLKKLHYRERVSTINSLTSTIGRRHLSGNVFYSDPDVFILRHSNNDLTPNQRYTLFLLNHIFGSLVFTSDNLDDYTEEELQLYLSQFPVRQKHISQVEHAGNVCKARFTIDGREYIAFANLGKNDERVRLEAGVYFGRGEFLPGDTTFSLMPYESVCLLKAGPDDLAVVGSTGHMFPGCEVSRVTASGENILVEFDERTTTRRDAYIRVPEGRNPEGAGAFMVNGKVVRAQQVCGIRVIRVSEGD